MPVESDEDRRAFFDADDHGVEATYAPAAGGSAAILGLFLDPSIDVTGFERAGGLDRAPVFVARTSDIPAGAVGGDAGDMLTIGVVSYRVLNIRPDGTGMTRIELGRAS